MAEQERAFCRFPAAVDVRGARRLYCGGWRFIRPRRSAVDRRTLEAIVEEIAPEVAGRRIARAYLVHGQCLVVELAPPRPAFLVLVSLRSLPLVFLAEDGRDIPAPPRQGRPTAAERELSGATLASLEPAEAGLALVLHTTWTGEAGRVVERALRIELAKGRRTPTHPQPTLKEEEHRRRVVSPNDVARRAFVESWASLDLERRRDALRKVIARELGRKLRAIAKVKAELADSTRVEEYRRKGQLLLARQGLVKRGASVVTVRDFDDQTLVEIELNPSLGVAKNAEVFFGRARKAERRAERVPRRLAELEGEAKSLTEIEAHLPSASDDRVTAFESRFFPPEPEPRNAPADASERARFRTYTVSGGWEVLVGKSNYDNDILSHKIARPNDLWFHARQCPGSHVILRRGDRKAEPDKEAILEAAAIAAFHSKAGKSSKVAVCYTEKRHVRKPRGGKPGLAVVAREKVVVVKPKLPEG
jgi:predicted ribosome quality control (RQC) complex YloA/Tae2 family protein